MNTQVNFRTNKRTLAKADKIFQEMGMDRSTALNMFLNRVEAEKGLPFTPTADLNMLRTKWDKDIEATRKTRGYRSAKAMARSILK